MLPNAMVLQGSAAPTSTQDKAMSEDAVSLLFGEIEQAPARQARLLTVASRVLSPIPESDESVESSEDEAPRLVSGGGVRGAQRLRNQLQTQRLQALEAENAHLKSLVVTHEASIAALQEVIAGQQENTELERVTEAYSRQCHESHFLRMHNAQLEESLKIKEDQLKALRLSVSETAGMGAVAAAELRVELAAANMRTIKVQSEADNLRETLASLMGPSSHSRQDNAARFEPN